MKKNAVRVAQWIMLIAVENSSVCGGGGGHVYVACSINAYSEREDQITSGAAGYPLTNIVTVLCTCNESVVGRRALHEEIPQVRKQI